MPNLWKHVSCAKLDTEKLSKGRCSNPKCVC